MKKIIFLLVMVFTISIQAQNQEVQQTIETFFEGFHARDSVKIKSVCSDKMILQSIAENAKGGKLTDESVSEFYHSIAGIPANLDFQEKLLSYSIQVDGTMAQVWTPYEFYMNGKLSHKGVNAFTLFKDNGIWKIIYIIDTRRR